MKKFNFLYWLFTVVIIIIAISNWRNNTQFLDISIYHVLNLLIVIFIAHYLTQKKTDERKLKDNASKLLEKFQEIIADERFVKIKKKDDIFFINQKHRKLSNIITNLNLVSSEFEIVADLEYIIKNLDEHREFVGDHVTDFDYLSKSGKELSKLIDLIEGKIDKIQIGLYLKN